MIPTEQPSAGPQRQLSRFVVIKGFNGMVEEGVADEVVFRLVISADEHDGQSPALLCSIAVCRSAGALIRKVTGGVIPSPKMTVKSKLGLLRKFRQHGLHANFDRLFLMVEIAAAMKVVLVDHWPPIEPLEPQHQVESLANCRFPDIVAADQECVARQVYDTMSDASEVRDRQTLHFHRVQPLLMPVYSPCSGNLRGKTPAKPYPPPSNPPILAIEVGDLGSGRPPASFRRTLTAALA